MGFLPDTDPGQPRWGREVEDEDRAATRKGHDHRVRASEAEGPFDADDVTIGRLAENVGRSPRGVVVRDELSGWFASFTRYSGTADGSDLPNWLSLFAAGPLRYHRKTGEPRDG